MKRKRETLYSSLQKRQISLSHSSSTFFTEYHLTSHQTLGNLLIPGFSASKTLLHSLKPDRILSMPQSETIGCLFCLNFSPSGEFLASTTADAVQIWQHTQNPQLKHVFTDHSEIVTALNWFHGQNDSFITSSLDKTIRIYRHFECVSTLTRHTDWIRCLGLRQDNTLFVSGCVSSLICGWDMEKEVPLFKIPKAHFSESCPDLNSINALEFAVDGNYFASGARDGEVKFWDTRKMNKEGQNDPIVRWKAHENKLNCLSFSLNGRHLLSGGRDSAIKLWDVRKIKDLEPLREFKEHKCVGYNVNCTFFNNEENILTGSEDKQMVIYDTRTGEVEKRLKESHPSVVHLVAVTPESYGAMKVVSSCIANVYINVWTLQPGKIQEKGIESDSIETQRSAMSLHEKVVRLHKAALDSMMRKYGDKILEIFHKHNFTFSTDLDWIELLRRVEPDQESADLINMVNAIADDFYRVFRFFISLLHHPPVGDASSTPALLRSFKEMINAETVLFLPLRNISSVGASLVDLSISDDLMTSIRNIILERQAEREKAYETRQRTQMRKRRKLE